jgi:hypothetical protein
MHLAFEYAEKNNIPHRFNKVTKAAGRHWVQDFYKMNHLTLRAPGKYSLGRIIGFNKPQCQRFSENLKMVSEEKFPAHLMFNMDGSGLSSVPNKIPKVISPKVKPLVSKVVFSRKRPSHRSGLLYEPCWLFCTTCHNSS